jgi:prevent-host-death family protein
MEIRRRTYSVAEAKAKLSKLLDRVETGEELVITRRGRPIARIAPADIVRKKLPLPSLRGLRASQPKAKTPTTALIRELREASY